MFIYFAYSLIRLSFVSVPLPDSVIVNVSVVDSLPSSALYN